MYYLIRFNPRSWELLESNEDIRYLVDRMQVYSKIFTDTLDILSISELDSIESRYTKH